MFYNYSDSKFKIQLWVLSSMNILRVKSSVMWSSATVCTHLCTASCSWCSDDWWLIESVLITLRNQLDYWATRFLSIHLHPIMMFSLLNKKKFINKRSPWGAISLGLQRKIRLNFSTVAKGGLDPSVEFSTLFFFYFEPLP